MPTITIDLSDDQFARVKTAFAKTFTKSAGQSDEGFAKQKICEYIKGVVKEYEISKAIQDANLQCTTTRSNAENKAEDDFKSVK